MFQYECFFNLFLKDGSTPLHYACRNGHKETVVALIDRGADIHMIDDVRINYTSLYITLKYII